MAGEYNIRNTGARRQTPRERFGIDCPPMAMTCPRCQQPLPEPPPRFCPACGHDTLDVAEPAMPEAAAIGGSVPPPPPPPLPPYAAAPPPGGAGGGGGTPWERRQQIGFASAFVETTQQVLLSPSAFFRSMPIVGGIGAPLLYGVIAGYIGHVVSALYWFVVNSTMGMSFPASGSGELDRLMPMMTSGMGLVGQILFGPIFTAIWLFVVSAIVHVCLMLVGGATSGFEATLRVAAYSEAAMILRIVPMCGDAIGPIYYVVLMIIGVAEAHRISGVRAAAAVLLPVILLCCCCPAAIGVLAGGIASMVGHAR